MFTQTRFAAGIIMLTIIAGLIGLTGCDERNEADIPQDVYMHQATYTVGSVIKFVDADDNHVALAAGALGTQVLDFTNVSNPVLLAEYLNPAGTNSEVTLLSRQLGIVGTLYDDHLYWGQSSALNYQTGDTVGTLGISSQIVELKLVIADDQQSFNIWGTDRSEGDGLVGIRYCWDGTAMEWNTSNCPFTPPSYDAEPNNSSIRGFDVKDSVIAIAVNQNGLHFENSRFNTGINDYYTPGLAQDCEWYGDYLIVADQYFLTIVDAADLMNPVLVTKLIIPNADRLKNVGIDDHYAILLDEYDGVYVVDISDLANPQLVQEIKLVEPSSLDVDNHRIYVTDEQIGLLVYTR